MVNRRYLLKIHFIMSCFSKYLIYNALSVIFFWIVSKNIYSETSGIFETNETNLKHSCVTPCFQVISSSCVFKLCLHLCSFITNFRYWKEMLVEFLWISRK